MGGNTSVLQSTTFLTQYSWIFSEYQLFWVLEYNSNTIFLGIPEYFLKIAFFEKLEYYSGVLAKNSSSIRDFQYSIPFYSKISPIFHSIREAIFNTHV